MKFIPWLAAVAIGCIQTVAAATEFSVGGATVQLRGDNWTPIALGKTDKDYSSLSANIEQEHKAFFRTDASGVNVVLLISSTRSVTFNASGSFRYTVDCKNSQYAYAEGNNGPSEQYMDCTRVFVTLPQPMALEAFAPVLFQVRERLPAGLPETFNTVLSSFGNSSGWSVEVRAFLSPRLQEQSNVAPIKQEVQGVSPNAVHWGRELAKAVRQSVTSISGRLEIPAVEFSQ